LLAGAILGRIRGQHFRQHLANAKGCHPFLRYGSRAPH
jgi:hypothetical protein